VRLYILPIAVTVICVACVSTPTPPGGATQTPPAATSPTPLTRALNVSDSIAVILYHDPANLDQLDGMTWDGRMSGRITTGIRYAAVLPNSAGTRYVLGSDVYNRSATVVAQVPVDKDKVFGGIWADDQMHYCQVVRISPDAPPQGEQGCFGLAFPVNRHAM
jgi:hypothetical protein